MVQDKNSLEKQVIETKETANSSKMILLWSIYTKQHIITEIEERETRVMLGANLTNHQTKSGLIPFSKITT